MVLKSDNGNISTKALWMTFIAAMLLKCFGYASVYRLILFAGPRKFSMVPVIIVWASEQLVLDKFVMSVCKLICSLCFDVDACSFHVCKSYQDCVVVDNKAKCQCPRCASPDDRVCADNGKSYPSECYMRAKACKIKRPINMVKKGECGTEVKYVYSVLFFLLFNVSHAENRVCTECGILDKKYRNLSLFSRP